MDVIVSLCGNSMIIIDQPVIILTFIDNNLISLDKEYYCVIVW